MSKWSLPVYQLVSIYKEVDIAIEGLVYSCGDKGPIKPEVVTDRTHQHEPSFQPSLSIFLCLSPSLFFHCSFSLLASLSPFTTASWAHAKPSSSPGIPCQQFTRPHPVWSNKETRVFPAYTTAGCHYQLTHQVFSMMRSQGRGGCPILKVTVLLAKDHEQPTALTYISIF